MVGIALAPALVSLATGLQSTRSLALVLTQENGPVELATFLTFVIAACYAALAGFDRDRPLENRAAAFLFCFFCIFVAGEEVSWGQSFFDWPTPASWAALNVQEETNLHNISGVTTSLLRTLYAAFVLMGALALKRGRLAEIVVPKALRWWFWLILGYSSLELMLDVYDLYLGSLSYALHIALRQTPSEIVELYVGVSALLYALFLRRQTPPTTGPDAVTASYD